MSRRARRKNSVIAGKGLERAVACAVEELEARQMLAVLATSFVADNVDPTKAVFVGTWKPAATEAGFFGSNYMVGTGKATFKPVAPTANYDVFLRWTAGSGHANNVPVDMKFGSTTTTLLVDQTVNGGKWAWVGTYTFTNGAGGTVSIRTDGANGTVIADAVLLQRTTAVPTGAPVAPGSLAVSSANSYQVNLAWADRSSGETGFRIERSVDNKTWTSIVTAAANATSFQDKTVKPDTLYFYRLRTAYKFGDSIYSAVASTRTPKLPPPTAPTGLSATASAYNKVNLKWTDTASNETAFAVERTTNPTTWTRIATLGANVTTWSDTSTAEKTQYYYRVRAENAIGPSGYSNAVVLTTPAKTVTPPPVTPPTQPPTPPTVTGPLQLLKVSSNGRYLVKADSTPFFFLSDTAWTLYDRLNKTQADQYLTDRAAKGFNVIQTNLVVKNANVNGDWCFVNGDPTKPNEAYFKHVDYIIDKAASLGMYTVLMPSEGYPFQDGTYNPTNSKILGKYLGQRYAGRKVIFMLGSDTDPTTVPQGLEIVRAFASGITEGGGNDASKVLITFMASYNHSSADWFNNDSWLDFNYIQSGHHSWDNSTLITKDYTRTPTRPTIDGECVFETIPQGLVVGATRMTDYDVRKARYWSVFAGAYGAAYGDNNIWQFAGAGPDLLSPNKTWQAALSDPGASQMVHLRRLMESRPFLSRVPDNSVVVSSLLSGSDLIRATRDSGGAYAMIYSAGGKAFTVNMAKISGGTANAYWVNPRTGAVTVVGQFAASGQRAFTPPSSGTGNDWVLVIDDATKGYTAPGSKSMIPAAVSVTPASILSPMAVTKAYDFA